MPEFVRALEASENQPHTLFSALETMIRKRMPVRLFSMTIVDFGRNEARRIYTNEPEIYPVSGLKPIPSGPWSDTVLFRKEAFVANDYSGIQKNFPDHEVIRSLGCEAIINVPVVLAGRLLGTLNILGAAGSYPDECVKAAVALKPYGTLCFLAHEQLVSQGKDDA